MSRILKNAELTEAEKYLEICKKLALKSTCQRRKCGSVIVNDGYFIGMGYNSLPASLESQRRCQCDKSKYHPKITDKTCCAHAERRAMDDALIRNHQRLFDSRIYFASIDSSGNIEKAGEPYCTRCSKDALDLGIAEWALNKEEGIVVYGAEEYNDLSYNFKG